MQLALALRLVGLLLILYSLTLLPPILIALWDDHNSLSAFLWTFCLMLIVGAALWLRRSLPFSELRARDGFTVTVVFWVVLSCVSALPLYLSIPHLSLAQAVFEAVSGFTTTGATVLTGIDQLPTAILYYRQQLHFFGGLGIVVLAVAILPMLGLGGYQLQRAEASGPMRDEKLSPRVTHAAKLLLVIYSLLNLFCALAFKLAGMTWFDAITHSFATIATGGFSTHDASIGYYKNNLWIEWVAIVFMLLGSFNITVHYLMWRKKNLLIYWRDAETRAFLQIVTVLVLITAYVLYLQTSASPLEAIQKATFMLVSLMTTTGFVTDSYWNWPLFLPVLVFGSGFLGGCVGSTTGGLKIMRVVLLYKQGMRELLRLIHPNAVIQVRIGERTVSERMSEALLGFTFMYMASYLILSMMMMATGLDIVDAFSATSTCINNVGPALGGVAETFKDVNSAGLWISSFAMLLGRLEIFALLVVLTPAFWNH